MTQTLHCLGTVGYHPNESRHTSCYFLPAAGIMLDAGSGLFRSFPLIVQPELHILLSHAHLDHILGLTFLWNAFFHSPLERVFVWGEADKLAAIREHLFSELIFPAEPKIHWQPLPSTSSFMIGNCQVTHFPVDHPGGAVGYRLDLEEKSIGYITDTHATPAAAYWSRISAVDLLLHECNFITSEKDFAVRTGHTDLGSLCECLLQLPKIRRVLLSHINTMSDQVRQELRQIIERHRALQDMSIEVASDLQTVEI